MYQLHNFSDGDYVQPEEPEEPEEPEITLGCLNEQAINFNPLANTPPDVGALGSCFFPITITPVEITSHGDSAVIPITFEDVPSEGGEVIVSESELYDVMLEEPEPIYDPYTAEMISSEGFEILVFNGLFGTGATVGTLINIYNYSEELILGNVPIIYQHSYYSIYIQNNSALDYYHDELGYIGILSEDTIEEEPTQQLVNPDIQIIWNKSDNIHGYIPELDINTIDNAYYKVFIYGQAVNDLSPIPTLYESPHIHDNSSENNQFGHIINLGEFGLPQNESLSVVVQSFNTTIYNEQSVYSNSPTDGFSLVWGVDAEQTDTTVLRGDVNLDGTINVIDIDYLINYILGTYNLSEDSEAFLNADINNDGIVNIIDIVNLIHIILEG